MIRLADVTFRYAGYDDGAAYAAPKPVLKNINIDIHEAELVLISGRTGSGKSTLLKAMNGLVPHFSGGALWGSVTIDGRSTQAYKPRELADIIGFVGQDPQAGFVSDTVEEELAYGMEQLGIPPQVMRRRVEETLDLLGIADLRHRPLNNLSGGQQQRVAIGSVLAMHPKYVVLDEPTSALDPTAAEEVLATLARLVDDLNTGVVLAEHRMERVIPFADRMVHLENNTVAGDGTPAEVLAHSEIAPPIIELGRLAGWQPLPVSTRQARRHAQALRERLTDRPSEENPVSAKACGTSAAHSDENGEAADGIVHTQHMSVRYGDTIAVRDVTMTLRRGAITVLMGRNGSGKSSLMWGLQGAISVQGGSSSGTVRIDGVDPGDVSAKAARSLISLVPQTASDLLYLDTVRAECEAADHQADGYRGTGGYDGKCLKLLDNLAPAIQLDQHPRDLSEGQKLALVLAIQLTAAPQVVLLDEPTRGLDYRAKAALANNVMNLAAQGTAVMLATHDVEFAATVADRVIVMAQGEVVSHGPKAAVLAESPAFAPQVAKVLGPRWLTVADVAYQLQTNL